VKREDVSLTPDSRLVDHVHVSPNTGPRRDGLTPTILILHYTGMKSAKAAIELLADPASMVSCHYVIDETGVVIQMVPESLRAWHAGKSHWGGIDDVNSASIGIEIHNAGHDGGLPAFPARQMRSVEALSRDICTRNGIPGNCVLAHSDVAPGRKIDPGERFDWKGLALGGVGHWVPPARVRTQDEGLGLGAAGSMVREMQDLLRGYGYGVEPTGLHDRQTELAVLAFQRHFRQRRVDGRIDRSSLETLEKLIAAMPSRAEA